MKFLGVSAWSNVGCALNLVKLAHIIILYLIFYGLFAIEIKIEFEILLFFGFIGYILVEF